MLASKVNTKIVFPYLQPAISMLLSFWPHTVCERVCLRATVVVVDWRQHQSSQFTAGQFISLDHHVLPLSYLPFFCLVYLSFLYHRCCMSITTCITTCWCQVEQQENMEVLMLKRRDGNKGYRVMHIFKVCPVEQCR